MEWLKAYIINTVTIALVGGMATLLLPEGKIKRFARFGTALVLSLAMILPIADIIKNGVTTGLELPEVTDKEVCLSSTEIEKVVRLYSGYENATVEVNGKRIVVFCNGKNGIIADTLKIKQQGQIKTILSAVYSTEEIYFED